MYIQVPLFATMRSDRNGYLGEKEIGMPIEDVFIVN